MLFGTVKISIFQIKTDFLNGKYFGADDFLENFDAYLIIYYHIS